MNRSLSFATRSRSRSATRRARGRSAFSLVELMVVIGIIILLVGLVLAVSTAMVAQSEARETRNTLALLDTAMSEWELSAQRTISYGTNQTFNTQAGQLQYVFDIPATTADSQLIIEVLRRLRGDEGVEAILSRINPEFLKRLPNGDQEIVDAWGERLRVVFSGREFIGPPVSSSDTGPDADGTIRLPLEDRLGVVRNRTVLFVSAGPDGQFGDLSGTEAQRELAADNLYSYDPIQP